MATPGMFYAPEYQSPVEYFGMGGGGMPPIPYANPGATGMAGGAGGIGSILQALPFLAGLMGGQGGGQQERRPPPQPAMLPGYSGPIAMPSRLPG